MIQVTDVSYREMVGAPYIVGIYWVYLGYIFPFKGLLAGLNS